MATTPALPDALAEKLVVNRQDQLSSLPSQVYRGSYTQIAFVKVYHKSADPNVPGSQEIYYISDYQAQLLISCGIERTVCITTTDSNGELHQSFVDKKFPNLHQFVQVDAPRAKYKSFQNAMLLPYIYIKRMYEVIVSHGLRIPSSSPNTPEKSKFFMATIGFLVWENFKDLYNDYSKKMEDDQFEVVKIPPVLYALDDKKLLDAEFERIGGYLDGIIKSTADKTEEGVLVPAGTEYAVNASDHPEYFSATPNKGEVLKEWVDKEVKTLLIDFSLVPQGYDWKLANKSPHPRSLIQYASTCTLLLMHKPNNNIANTVKYLEARKKAFFNSINDPNEEKVKLNAMYMEADLVECARYLRFYPQFYRQLYTMVIASTDPWTSYAKTLLVNSQATMFNLILKFITATTKTKLHTFQEVLYEMTIWKQKYDQVKELLPTHFQYYKLYYPGGKLTDCNELGVLTVAAFTWYCYKESATAKSMTNYGLAKNYFSKHFLRMAMTPVPDELYGDASTKKLSEYQALLEDLPGWNINLNELLKKDSKGKKVLVFEDIKTNVLDDFYTQFVSRIPAAAP